MLRPETEEYGISSFVYRADRPFHPQRLHDFVTGYLSAEDDADLKFGIHLPRVLRSKGFFWLASRPKEMLIWSQAGGLFQLSGGGQWLSDSSPDVVSAAVAEGAEWSSELGDRRQELVFIGTGLDSEQLRQKLDACLATEAESQTAIALDDPFPPTDSNFLDANDHPNAEYSFI